MLSATVALAPDTLVNNWRARFNVLRFQRESEAVTWPLHSQELTYWNIPGSKPNLRENWGEQRYVLVVRTAKIERIGSIHRSWSET